MRVTDKRFKILTSMFSEKASSVKRSWTSNNGIILEVNISPVQYIKKGWTYRRGKIIKVG